MCEVGSGTVSGTFQVPGSGAVIGVAWDSSGRQLLCGTEDGSQTLWDIESQKLIVGHGPTGGVALTGAFSVDGHGAAVGFEDGAIESGTKACHAGRGNEYSSPPGPNSSVAFSPDTFTLASASHDKTIKLWNLHWHQPGRSRDTIQSFFRLVGVLTDRDDIEFLRVRDDHRVLVKVADSTEGVPLEVLSQGMTSLYGWIGVLCQRLKETLEIPTQEPLPTNSYALVLIDELDAHMHPKWQQGFSSIG